LTAQPADDIRLTGIIAIPDLKWALFQEKPGSSVPNYYALQEEQSWQGVEAVQINAETGKVKINLEGAERELSLYDTQDTNAPEGPTSAAPTIQLRNVGFDQMVELYARLVKRTVLRPSLAPMSFTLNGSPTNVADLASVIANALAGKGMTNIPDGDKFVFVVPFAQAPGIVTHPAKFKSAPVTAKDLAPTGKAAPDEIVTAGEICFPSVDIGQVAEIYAQLIGRGLQPLTTSPGIRVSLITQTPLTKEEAAYALETVFRLNGFKVVPTSGGLIQLAPVSEK
jgi:hypothetical protein